MMGVISRFSPEQEIYSVDECFLGLDGFPIDELADWGSESASRCGNG